MIYPTHKGKTYGVTCTEECVVTNGAGEVLCSAQPRKQATFVATGSSIDEDSSTAEITDVTYSIGGSGGGNTTIDEAPTNGSGNAVSSGGMYKLLYGGSVALGTSVVKSAEDVTIGKEARTGGAGAVAVGKGAKAGQQSVAIGFNASANNAEHCVSAGYGASTASANYSIAIGRAAAASKPSGQVLGYSAKLNNKGCTLIGTWESEARTVQTLLYIIAAGSELATQYEGGEACLGYVVKESSGNVLACGARKLSELLTTNTAFAPVALALDADPPTPFLPEGIMEPVKFES